MREKLAAGWERIRGIFHKRAYEILAVTVSLAVLCIFVSMKQGYHMDELLSFELSNAEFNPWIVPTQPEGRLARFVHNEIDGESFGETFGNLVDVVKDLLENRGNSKLLTYKAQVYEEPVWISREEFADYIQVNSKDAFNYLSVYFNVKDDNHPPFHFMLLHTVSSIFQGRATAWMGCLINLAAVTVILFLLMKLSSRLAEELGLAEYKRAAGILCALFYGLSAGAVATVLLIRMYGVLTLSCVAYFYLILKKWEDREFERRNFLLILVTLLGFWTHYFFLFYCMLLAALTGVLLLRRKRLRELICFVRSMVIAAVVGVAVFPFAIQDVFSSGRGVEALDNLSAGFAGYGQRLLDFLKIVGNRTFYLLFWVLVAILAAAVLFLRKKTVVGEEGEKGKESRGSKEDMEDKEDGRAALVLLLVCPPVGYFLLAARMSPYLVDRYVMPIFPFVFLAGTLALFALMRAAKDQFHGKISCVIISAACVVVSALQLTSLYDYDGSYLYQGYGEQERVAERNADYPCICVYDGVGYYENLLEFTHYKKTLLLTWDQLTDRQETGSIQELDQVAVLIKRSSRYDADQVLAHLSEQYGFAVEKWGWSDPGVHGDLLIFMRKDV